VTGPCARTLEANELIWMTDRTPHESLPIPTAAAAAGTRRQYFRLVVGQVSAWFADHSTPNPSGFLPPGVRVVRGDKFTLYPTVSRTWNAGTAKEIARAYAFQEVRLLLVEHSLGHLVQRMFDYGARSLSACVLLCQQCGNSPRGWDREHSKDGKSLIDEDDYGYRYYELDCFKQFLLKAEETVRSRKNSRSGAKSTSNSKSTVTQSLKHWLGF